MPVTPNSVITPQAVKTAQASCATAKSSYGNLTNAVLLLTAGANGAVLYGLTCVPTATVAATQCQLFTSPDGTAAKFVRAATMSAYTMAASTSPTPTDFGFTESSPRRLRANEQLWVGIGVTGAIDFDAQYEDL